MAEKNESGQVKKSWIGIRERKEEKNGNDLKKIDNGKLYVSILG